MKTSTTIHATKIQPTITHYMSDNKSRFSTLSLAIYGQGYVKGSYEEILVNEIELFFSSEDDFNEGVEPLCHMLVGRLLPTQVNRVHI